MFSLSALNRALAKVVVVVFDPSASGFPAHSPRDVEQWTESQRESEFPDERFHRSLVLCVVVAKSNKSNADNRRGASAVLFTPSAAVSDLKRSAHERVGTQELSVGHALRSLCFHR
jgi:hypothetical protein